MEVINIDIILSHFKNPFGKNKELLESKIEFLNYIQNKSDNIVIMLPEEIKFKITDELLFILHKNKSPLNMFISRKYKKDEEDDKYEEDKKEETKIIDLSDESINPNLIIVLFINLYFGYDLKYEYLLDAALFDQKYIGIYSDIYFDELFEETKENLFYAYKNKEKFLNLIGMDPKYAINIIESYLVRHLIPNYPSIIEDNIDFVLHWYPYTLYKYFDILEEEKEEEKKEEKKKKKSKKIMGYLNREKYKILNYSLEELKDYEDKKHKKYLLDETIDGTKYLSINNVMRDMNITHNSRTKMILIGQSIKSSYTAINGRLPSKIDVLIQGNPFNSSNNTFTKLKINHYNLRDHKIIEKIIKRYYA